GPLWIQVQALEKGLEILVTKAHLSKGGTPVDSIEDIDETIDITINEKAKQMLDDKKEPSEGSENAGLTEDDSSLWMTARSEEHTSELQSRFDIVCRILLENIKI